MSDRAEVPCNGCTECCKREAVILHPEHGDDPGEYETKDITHPLTGKPATVLKHKPDGGCIYLGKNGCTIHDRAPAMCREFDCRRLFRDTTRAERKAAVKSGKASKRIFEAGKKRLHTLEDSHG